MSKSGDSKKWKICFAPWKLSETGLIIKWKVTQSEKLASGIYHGVVRLTLNETNEFVSDLLTALFKRYDVNFLHDTQPRLTKEQAYERLVKVVQGFRKTPSYAI